MKKSHGAYSEKLVQRVNELYHDFFSERYDYSHPEIFEQEKARWERIASRFFSFSKPITIIDIGTGTGFVPLSTAKFLKEEDVLICSDISKRILDVAKKNIDKHNFHCQFKFVKIESQVPLRLPLETKSVDIVTMNSVLHHIKDTGTLLSEVDRIQKLNGLLFVGHEPNKRFFEDRFLLYNYLLVDRLIDPKITVYKILRKIRLEKVAERICLVPPKERKAALERKEIAKKINDMLLEEKLIKQPMLPEEIFKIIDIRAAKGFNPDMLLPNYEILHLETYNHMHWVTIRHHSNSLIRKYDNLLRKKYPVKGSTFFIVLRKKSLEDTE